MNESPSFYAIIPADVRYCTAIPDGAKLLYGEITALCNKEGYCWATNAYFAKLYNCSSDTISRWITTLAECSFLNVEIDKSKGNQRLIYLAGAIRKNADTLSAKMPIPIRKNAEQNNTYNTTLKNNTDNAETQFENWLRSIKDDPTTREVFTLSRKVPAVKFEEYFEVFTIEAKAKKETYHKRSDLLSHFLNFSVSKYQNSTKKYSGAGPGRAADPVRYSLPASTNPAELVEPKYRKL